MDRAEQAIPFEQLNEREQQAVRQVEILGHRIQTGLRAAAKEGKSLEEMRAARIALHAEHFHITEDDAARLVDEFPPLTGTDVETLRQS